MPDQKPAEPAEDNYSNEDDEDDTDSDDEPQDDSLNVVEDSEGVDGYFSVKDSSVILSGLREVHSV